MPLESSAGAALKAIGLPCIRWAGLGRLQHSAPHRPRSAVYTDPDFKQDLWTPPGFAADCSLNEPLGDLCEMVEHCLLRRSRS